MKRIMSLGIDISKNLFELCGLDQKIHDFSAKRELKQPTEFKR